MKRLGGILIPMLGGFLLTVAVASWHAAWWPRHESAAATQWSVAPRRSNLRIAQVQVTAASPAAAVHAAPARAAPEAEPSSALYELPPVPRVDPGNSPERLDASARKFAHGSRTDED